MKNTILTTCVKTFRGLRWRVVRQITFGYHFFGLTNSILRRFFHRHSQQKKDFMLISLPRSGTDWLMHNIVLSNRKRIRYCREFFNPICNPVYGYLLAKSFGANGRFYKSIAVPWQLQKSDLDKIYSKTWRRTAFNMTKENYSGFKVGYFITHFTVFALYRHRKYTFPGKADEYATIGFYRDLYESLLVNRDHLGLEARSALEFCLHHADTDYKKCCASSILFHYVMFEELYKFSIPIADYEILVKEKNKDKLKKYLENTMPPDLVNDQLVTGIITSSDASILSEKERMYSGLGVEYFCKQVLDILGVKGQSNPHFALLS